MKKLLAMLLMVVMMLALVACSNAPAGGDNTNPPSTNDGGNNGGDDSGIDMSKYPAKLGDWTVQNLADYFTEAGVFTEGSDREVWVQDHATYWSDTPFNECSGYWDDEGMILIMFYTFDPTLPDTTEEDVNAMMDYIKENHMLTEEYMSMPIDHMADGVAFSFAFTADEDVYNAAEATYAQLIAAMGVTPDF